MRGARLLDPRAGLDGVHDLLVRDGRDRRDRRRARSTRRRRREVVDGEGLTVFPGSSIRTSTCARPGARTRRTSSRARAAAAGGFCAILAMPNTDPVVDAAPVLRSLQERAARRRSCRSGSWPRSRKGPARHRADRDGRAGARGRGAGFSDDGLPVADAPPLRQALQYQRLAGGVLALHEEDPSLSGAGVMHEGAISTMLGLAGIPSISESTMIERDAPIARYEGGRIHILHLSAAESVEAVERARAAGVQVTAEVTPHHLVLTDEAVRSLDPRFKMNPPLRSSATARR